MQRLPRAQIRVGEAVVALPYRAGERDAEAAVGGPRPYRTIEGVEYRVMRLETEDGKPLFKVDGRDPSI